MPFCLSEVLNHIYSVLCSDWSICKETPPIMWLGLNPLTCDTDFTCWGVTQVLPVEVWQGFTCWRVKWAFTCWVRSEESWVVSRCRSSWRRPDPPYTADSATYCFLLTSPLSGIISDTPDKITVLSRYMCYSESLFIECKRSRLLRGWSTWEG